MITHSCCCSPQGCTGATAFKDTILAVDLGDLACNLTGTLTPKYQVSSDSIDYIETSFNGCANLDCCLICGDGVCTSFCTSKKNIVVCLPIHVKNESRYFPDNATASYCSNCEDAPVVDCQGCAGFPATSFTSNGFDSRAALSIIAPGCDAGAATRYTIATKTSTVTTGNKTVVLKKKLTVGVTTSAIANTYPSCVMMTLQFRIDGSTTGSCADTVSQFVVYHSVWNGTDTAAQFLAKPMTLHVVNWLYDVCLYNTGASGYCGGYDIASFVQAVCFSDCTAIPYSIDYTEEAATIIPSSYECPPSTSATLIDPDWQPWQTVPSTISPL